MSYLPTRSCGTAEKASSLCIVTFAGSHCLGGNWDRSISKPSSCVVLGSVLESSTSQILDIG